MSSAKSFQEQGSFRLSLLPTFLLCLTEIVLISKACLLLPRTAFPCQDSWSTYSKFFYIQPERAADPWDTWYPMNPRSTRLTSLKIIDYCGKEKYCLSLRPFSFSQHFLLGRFLLAVFASLHCQLFFNLPQCCRRPQKFLLMVVCISAILLFWRVSLGLAVSIFFLGVILLHPRLR